MPGVPGVVRRAAAFVALWLARLPCDLVRAAPVQPKHLARAAATQAPGARPFGSAVKECSNAGVPPLWAGVSTVAAEPALLFAALQ